MGTGATGAGASAAAQAATRGRRTRGPARKPDDDANEQQPRDEPPRRTLDDVISEMGLEVVPEDGGTHLSALLYAKTGAGKTALGALVHDAAILNVEPQGYWTIQEMRQRYGVAPAVWGRKDASGARYARDMDEVRAFVLLAKRGVFLEQGRTKLVFDGITEIQQLLKDEIKRGKRKNRHVFDKRDWGELADRMILFLRTVRDLCARYDVLMLARADWTDDEESGQRMLTPLVKGGAGKEIGGYFNLVGYLYKRTAPSGEIERYVTTEGDDRIECKPFRGLTGVLRPDFDAWVEAINDPERYAEVVCPDAPLPGEEQARRRSGVRRDRFAVDDDDDTYRAPAEE